MALPTIGKHTGRIKNLKWREDAKDPNADPTLVVEYECLPRNLESGEDPTTILDFMRWNGGAFDISFERLRGLGWTGADPRELVDPEVAERLKAGLLTIDVHEEEYNGQRQVRVKNAYLQSRGLEGMKAPEPDAMAAFARRFAERVQGADQRVAEKRAELRRRYQNGEFAGKGRESAPADAPPPPAGKASSTNDDDSIPF